MPRTFEFPVVRADGGELVCVVDTFTQAAAVRIVERLGFVVEAVVEGRDQTIIEVK